METNTQFVNSGAYDSIISCLVCGAENDASSNYCQSCGNKLTFLQNDVLSDLSQKENVNKSMIQSDDNIQKNEDLVFAQGLPEWSLEPPQMMVRRHNG